MERFHVVDEAAVILRSKGVFKQAKAYIRGRAVYAGASGGFVRLYKGGGTSMPNISWEDIDLNGIGADSLASDIHGKLSFNGAFEQLEVTTK